MRINEDCDKQTEIYTMKQKAYVEEVFQYCCTIQKLHTVLDDIQSQALSLKELCLTDQEKKERQELFEQFDFKMQSMTIQTMKNRERYQISGWQDLVYDEENTDESESE